MVVVQDGHVGGEKSPDVFSSLALNTSMALEIRVQGIPYRNCTAPMKGLRLHLNTSFPGVGGRTVKFSWEEGFGKGPSGRRDGAMLRAREVAVTGAR